VKYYVNSLILIYNIVAVPVCPVQTPDDKHINVTNLDNCMSDYRCPFGVVLNYTCTKGFIVSSPTATCLENHNWSTKPKCIEGSYRLDD